MPSTRSAWRPGGKRPCASGAYRTQRAGACSPYVHSTEAPGRALGFGLRQVRLRRRFGLACQLRCGDELVCRPTLTLSLRVSRTPTLSRALTCQLRACGDELVRRVDCHALPVSVVALGIGLGSGSGSGSGSGVRLGSGLGLRARARGRVRGTVHPAGRCRPTSSPPRRRGWPG